jgi:hypothetical protein
MNKLLLVCLFICAGFVSCKKDEFNGSKTNLPAIPVTVSNIYGMFNGVPTVSTSLSGGGAISIMLSIPAGSGRTIKEITRVGLGTVPTNFKVVETSTGLYNAAPLAGNGTSVNFTTSIAEFTAKSGINVTTSGTATSFLSRYFMFLITLDNGEQILPIGVRIYVAT